jgi:hypothetical protein
LPNDRALAPGIGYELGPYVIALEEAGKKDLFMTDRSFTFVL